MAGHVVAGDARKQHVVKCNLCDVAISDQTEAFKTCVLTRVHTLDTLVATRTTPAATGTS